jgi:hypothetical protein
MHIQHASANTSTRPQLVSVQYGDGHQSFWLAANATLADLAARIGEMDDDHVGIALTINVRVGMPVNGPVAKPVAQ